MLKDYPKLILTQGRKVQIWHSAYTLIIKFLEEKMHYNSFDPFLKLNNCVTIKQVLEVRPTIKWDKGKALEFLLESLGYASSNDVFPVYIGDDRTDEDAFKVLRSLIVTIF